MDLCLLDNTNTVVATGANNNVGGDPVEVIIKRVTFTPAE